MSLDPTLSLAFSVQANRGVYALLLGSGISRAAGIPTVREIVVHLIQKLAGMLGQDPGPDPVGWFWTRYGRPPDYSELLEELALTPSERHNLLGGYFEPSDEERAEGKKMPTPAHLAVADLVARGYVRVIITTNFDRLLEQALEARAVWPSVIAGPDDALGAVPLTHSRCTVIKVNGDYLDTRIKNTPEELARYEPEIKRLLDRVFDEFGLIVCGWSATWDTGLRETLMRCPNRRFTTWWTMVEEPKDAAKKLIQARRAVEMPIRDADHFFGDLLEKVLALEELDRPHPLTARVAVARLKRYIENNAHPIKAHDLVMEEAERLVVELAGEKFAQPPEGEEALNKRLGEYEALTGNLAGLMATGCYWAGQEQEHLWAKALERLANHPLARGTGEATAWPSLYPALLVYYAGGVAAVAAEKGGNLAALFRARIRVGEVPRVPGVLALACGGPLLSLRAGREEPRRTDLSGRLEEALYRIVEPLVSDPDDFHREMERFEALAALAGQDLAGRREAQGFGPPRCSPGGPGGWSGINGSSPFTRVLEEWREQGPDWWVLEAGLFGGAEERLEEAWNRLSGGLAE